MRYQPGRHGGMVSSEFTSLIERNAQFLSVRRTGRGDGVCGLHNAITGNYIMGRGGGWMPEVTFYRDISPQCIRGWRNILFELVRIRHVRATKEIRRVLGDEDTNNAIDRRIGYLPDRYADTARRYTEEEKTTRHVRNVSTA